MIVYQSPIISHKSILRIKLQMMFYRPEYNCLVFMALFMDTLLIDSLQKHRQSTPEEDCQCPPYACKAASHRQRWIIVSTNVHYRCQLRRKMSAAGNKLSAACGSTFKTVSKCCCLCSLYFLKTLAIYLQLDKNNMYFADDILHEPFGTTTFIV